MNLSSRIAALELDGSPKAVATLRYIQAILDGEVVIPGGISMLMAELGCDGYVNAWIDDAHFPGADPFVSIKGVLEVDVPMDSWNEAEAAAYLDTMVPPMKPVMPDKGIKYAAKNRDAQREHPLVISGQKCLDSDGRACILALFESVRGRGANLNDAQSRFHRGYRVLAELKETAPGA